LFTTICNIFPNHICHQLVPNCEGAISIFPKLPTPKHLFNFRMLFKYYTVTNTFKQPQHFENTIPRWKRCIDMILSNFQYIYCEIVILGNLFKYIFYTIVKISTQNPYLIFWSPYQVVFRIIYRMTLNVALIISIQDILFPAFGSRTSQPRLQNGVYKFYFCINTNYARLSPWAVHELG